MWHDVNKYVVSALFCGGGDSVLDTWGYIKVNVGALLVSVCVSVLLLNPRRAWSLGILDEDEERGRCRQMCPAEVWCTVATYKCHAMVFENLHPFFYIHLQPLTPTPIVISRGGSCCCWRCETLALFGGWIFVIQRQWLLLKWVKWRSSHHCRVSRGSLYYEADEALFGAGVLNRSNEDSGDEASVFGSRIKTLGYLWAYVGRILKLRMCSACVCKSQFCEEVARSRCWAQREMRTNENECDRMGLQKA